jgi:hypothetical protein
MLFLLDRLLDSKSSLIPPDALRGMLTAFSNVMDEVAVRGHAFKSNDASDVWAKSMFLLDSSLADAFDEAVRNGKSINWLAYVIRDQGFAHGQPTGDRRDSSRQWLSREQLARTVNQVVDRFRRAGADDIFRRPAPLDILFCWLQLGSENEVRHFFSEAIQEDEAFLIALEAIRGWSSSNEGIKCPLYKHYLSFFTDADAAYARLLKLSSGEKTSPKLRRHAHELLQDWSERSFEP